MVRKLIRIVVAVLALALMAGVVQPVTANAAVQKKEASKKKATKLVDINSASKAELDALPGIGEVYSQKIIDNRPYTGKDDLLNKKILPENTYNGIKDLIIAKQPKSKGGKKGKK